MKGYKQLTQEERYHIAAELNAGRTQKDVAEGLGVHPSTISRELRRNTGLRGYRPKQAHESAVKRQHDRSSRPRISTESWEHIRLGLREEWSPEQISNRLKLTGVASVSHESIYLFVYHDKWCGGTLHQHLRCQKQRRKRYGSGQQRRGQIANRRCISSRPGEIQSRLKIGHWEADTIMGLGHQQAIVTLVERYSRFTVLVRVTRATAEAVKNGVLNLLTPYSHRVESITSDNGKEFALHEEIAAALSAEFYFAHPYASWERGTNENTNGLIRQYLPKKTDFSNITDAEIGKIQACLNERPRKVLGYRTPNEVFLGGKKIALCT